MKTATNFIQPVRSALACALIAALSCHAHADAITDWNTKSGEIIIESKMGTPPAVRVMAIVQTAAYEAANAVTKRYEPSHTALDATAGVAGEASVDAAIAAAHRVALSRLVPTQVAAIDNAYQGALARVPEGAARAAGVSIGEKAAVAVLAARGNDGAGAPDAYRPHTTPGAYVPTATPAVPQWAQRKPWLLASPAQLRPGPPPSLASDPWARDFNEVKALGGRTSAQRSAEQTDIARFWDFSLPPIYHGIVRSVANMPARDATQNARLFALVSQAMDDGMIAVFDAKYHYNFWRPTTAIRNGDIDGHAATERDASWAPLIDVPMHPEYPSAHSILASSVATILKAEVGNGTMPALATSSPTAKGATRRWKNLDDFAREVGDARIYEGVHFRNSTEIGAAMGRKLGEIAVTQGMGALH